MKINNYDSLHIMGEMERSKFDKAINQSDLEEWIIETFPGWPEGDVRLIMDHLDEMPDVQLDCTRQEVATMLAEIQVEIRERTVTPQDNKNKIAKAFCDGWEYSQIRDFRIIQERKEKLLKGVKHVNS